MRRRRGWTLRLVEWGREVEGREFAWGETDCASLVAGALEALYEEPPVDASLAEYSSREEALRRHAETGGVEAVLREAGAEEVGLNFARDGDVLLGLPRDGELPGAAVVVEATYLVASEEEGVVRRPLRALRKEAPEDVRARRPPE